MGSHLSDIAGGLTGPTKLLILAEVRFYREGLALYFSDLPGIDVAGLADHPEAAVRAARTCGAQVVLLDMPLSDCVAAARVLASELPDAGLVAIGVNEDERDVVALAEAGVLGFVARDASLEELARSVVSAAAGESRCSPRVAAVLARRVSMLARRVAAEPVEIPLTARQVEIVRLIGDGLPNKVIAQRLFIEVPTVKNHVHNILGRLGVQRREDAVAALRSMSGGQLSG